MVTMPCSCRERHIRLVWTVLECLFFSGLVYRLNILSPVLKRDGLFSTYCLFPPVKTQDVSENNTQQHRIAGNTSVTNVSLTSQTKENILQKEDAIANITITKEMHDLWIRQYIQWQYDMYTYPSTCKLQESYLKTMQTIAVSVVGVLMLPFGYIFDRCGTLKVRILSIFLFTASTIMMAFTTYGKEWLLYLAVISIGVSGTLILLTNLQVANLFKRNQAVAILIFHGACDSSACILLLIKHSADTGLNFQSSFMFLTVGVVPLLIGTVAFLPKTHIPWPLPPDYHQRKTSFEQSFSAKRRDPRRACGLRSTLLSPLLLGQLFWFSVIRLRVNMFSATHETWLTTITSDEDAVSSYSQAYSISQSFGIFVSFLAAFTLTRKSSFDQGNHRLNCTVATCLLLYSTVFIMTVAFSVCALILQPGAQYPVYILQIFIRVLLLGSNSFFLIICFPSKHFGKLFGLTHGVSSVIGLIQLPIAHVTRADSHSLKIINALTVVFILATSIHIFIIWQKRSSLIHSNVPPSRSLTTLPELENDYTRKNVVHASNNANNAAESNI